MKGSLAAAGALAFCTACCSGLAIPAGGGVASVSPAFAKWALHHNKRYESTREAARRQRVFERNLLHYAERNRWDSATYGPDQFSDLTMEEFKAQQASCYSDDGDFDRIPSAEITALTVGVDGKMPSVDWRDPEKNSLGVNAVTPPKNQGAYGYCWAFGATGALEGMNVIQQKNPLVSLSEQELIDCCSPANEGPLQCWGHGPNMAWNFLINNTHGMDSTEESYPYNLHSRKGNNNQTCALKSGRTVNGTTIVAGNAKIGTYVSASADKETNNTDTVLAALLQYGPGNIGVDATCLFGYKGGVINNCTGKSVDHATLVVGAGYDSTVPATSPNPAGPAPYFIVKNSWGPGFGEGGFYRFERNRRQVDFTGAAFPVAAAGVGMPTYLKAEDEGAPVNPLHANVSCVAQKDVDHKYNDIRQVTVKPLDTAACCAACKLEPRCGIWVIGSPPTKCWLKSTYGKPGTQWVRAPGMISMCTDPSSAGKCSNTLPPSPPPPPPPVLVGPYVCRDGQCVNGTGKVSYLDPNCFGQCS